MKLEIEITEDELKNAVERKVRTAVADQTNQWGTDTYIKKRVEEHWKVAVDSLVQEALSNSDVLRKKIVEELEKKLRNQLSAVIRVQK
jgi:hypothetical protein